MPLRCAAIVWVVASGLVWAGAPGSAAAPQKPEDDLPDGRGKTILQASCTSCHDLDEVTKFKGYYTRTQWKDVVQTMVDYGAKLESGEAELLADYLAENLGRR